MTNLPYPNNVGKPQSYTWVAIIFIALVLVGYSVSISASEQVMIEVL